VLAGGGTAETIELERWNTALAANNNDVMKTIADSSLADLKLGAKCVEAVRLLRSLGDNGRAVVSPRFMWCGACKTLQPQKLGKINNLKLHFKRHHPLLGDVLRKEGDGDRISLAEMTDPAGWSPSPSSSGTAAGIGSSLRKFSAAAFRSEYENAPEAEALASTFGDKIPSRLAVIDLAELERLYAPTTGAPRRPAAAAAGGGGGGASASSTATAADAGGASAGDGAAAARTTEDIAAPEETEDDGFLGEGPPRPPQRVPGATIGAFVYEDQPWRSSVRR